MIMEHDHCTNCRRHKHPHAETPVAHIHPLRPYGRLLLSALMLVAGIMLHAIGIEWFASKLIIFCWYIAAYLPVGLPVLQETWKKCRRGSYFNEFTLMSLASIGAFYIGEYPEGVAVMLFYSFGELLQKKAVTRARRNIQALLDVRPQTATVEREGKTYDVHPKEVHPEEIIEVKTGGRIPLDGCLLTDTATFNTAALTGESIPRTLKQGDEVLSGMIPTDRVIRLKVIRSFDQSALSRILELVQHAASRKAPAELFIRRFARVYTPAVTGLAILVAVLPMVWSWIHPSFVYMADEWLYRALVFFVLSCPCALVVSIPLGYFGGIGSASRQGILLKGGNYLDMLAQVNTVIFDKTGTLTQGQFMVKEINPVAPLTSDKLLQLVASVEQGSTHPLAHAVINSARKQNIAIPTANEVTESSGHGLSAQVNGLHVLVGNDRMLAAHGICPPAQESTNENTSILCAVNGQYAGCLALSDRLKEDAPWAIQELKALNIPNIQMLSGDKQAIVTTFARILSINQAYGDLLPEDKVSHIETLRKNPAHRIAFVGDGLNDAPVLALSHVGIAMGGLGSDAAIETADVVIQTDQPSKVATSIRIGKMTRRIVWQNIVLALGIKLLVLILGAAGIANLWEAVFADVGVALIAIANAARVQRMKFS